jgi:hypothetical protein
MYPRISFLDNATLETSMSLLMTAAQALQALLLFVLHKELILQNLQEPYGKTF